MMTEVPGSRRRRIVMMQPRVSGASVPALYEVKGKPLAMAFPLSERRDIPRRSAIVRRIAAEFCEMPGLILTVRQASCLLGVDQDACERILGSLERDGLLRRRSNGAYGRA
jgi:hypothetical protein